MGGGDRFELSTRELNQRRAYAALINACFHGNIKVAPETNRPEAVPSR